MEFEKALKMPFQNLGSLILAFVLFAIGYLVYLGAAFSSVLTGGGKVAMMIGFVIFLLFVIMVYGYILKTMKNVINKKWQMATWSDFGRILTYGFGMVIVGIIYQIPLGIVYFLLSKYGQNLLLDATLSGGLPFFSSVMLLFALFIALALLTAYVVISAYFNMVKHDSFAKAFELGTVFRKAFTKKYFLAVFVSFVLIIGVPLGVIVVSLPFWFIPYVNILAVFVAVVLALFYMFAMIFTGYGLIAEAWR